MKSVGARVLKISALSLAFTQNDGEPLVVLRREVKKSDLFSKKRTIAVLLRG